MDKILTKKLSNLSGYLFSPTCMPNRKGAAQRTWCAKLYFKDEKERDRWIDGMAEAMLEKWIDPVIEEIENLPGHKGTDGKRNRLINYYRRNRDRMQYHGYIEKGLLIGSGAIESANRDVLQQRLKLSGQRWTMEGFQQMAQLRVVHKSGQWDRIRTLCQQAA